MRARDAKKRVDKDRKVAYQEKLDEYAYLRSIEGLETSDAPGYRSQFELMEAIKNHEVTVDRAKYVKAHCHDPDTEGKVKKNIGAPEAPPFLADGPVSKVYSLKQNYARPEKDVGGIRDEGKVKAITKEAPQSKRGLTSSEAA